VAKENLMRRFEDKVVLVTGAASGIGKATAQRFGQEGAHVACADRNVEGANATAAAIREAGGDAFGLACDVAQKESAFGAVAQTVERYGRLNVLASVAGVGGFARTIDETMEHWNLLIAVNLTGTFLMCQAALPHILESKGNIVVTASTAGIKSHPYAAAYCASKGGVVMLTRALAVEYARKGIRINCVCPGGVDTPIIQQFSLPPGGAPAQLMRIAPIMDRMGAPAEIAGSIAYLASDDATYVNGSIFVVDGAMTT
jgi:meso-butanediol dehydrogenase/(S,S)-butanediol dehydrogenase/diacetyl reductase